MIEKVKASGSKLPVDYLLDIMNDPNEPDRRLKVTAAQAAAPFIHPKLSVIENTEPDPRDSINEEEVLAKLRAMIDAKPELLETLLKVLGKIPALEPTPETTNVVQLKTS